MKTHTSQFKNTIKEFGREIDSKITYTLDNEEIELGSEELNSITPHYEGAILKSVMKQLDIDSNVEIPIGTILRYQFGLKVGNEYEYIDYGNYVVYSVEKQEDTYSYKITCYDKMLYAMKDYENSNITFPITVKDYLEAICEKFGLEYEGSQFANSDKVIDNELYLDNEGRSLEYTFRDVLDEIAQVSGGTICINNDDKLEVRYIHDVGELQTLTGSSLTLETDDAIKLDSFELEGNTTQETRSGKNSLNVPSEYTLTGANWINLELEPGTYTLSASNIDSTANKHLFLVRFPNSTYKYIYLTNTSLYETFTITDTSNQVTIYSSDGYNSSLSVTTTFSNFMLEKSSTPTSYEQYGASPSLDYPSDLVSVGYENLLNPNILEAGNIDTSTGQDSFGNARRTNDYITVEPSQVYSFQYKTTSTNKQIVVYEYSSSKSYLTYQVINDLNGSITLSSTTAYIKLRFSGDFSIQSSDIYNVQVEKGNQAHSYIPYGKYGIEVKTTGKNLFDIEKSEQGTIDANGNDASSNTAWRTKNYILVNSNNTYTISSLTSISKFIYQYEANGSFISVTPTGNNTSYTFTTNSKTRYIKFRVYYSNGTNYELIKDLQLQLEKGTQATAYEEYKSNAYLYTLDNPLRSIGDTKDLLYIKNGYLYVDRKIGNVVLNGSEEWRDFFSTTGIIVCNVINAISSTSTINCQSNYFKGETRNNIRNGLNNQSIDNCLSASGTELILVNRSITTTNDFKTWLSAHNTEVQYVLNEPYTEELGQVDMPSTYEGVTYIDAPNTMNVSYISEFEEIDEEYLKDVNVNFGEKFGAVNTIVLSRGGDGDKISLSIPSNLAYEDKIAIQITDNQIMNGNNRADFMQPILSQLYGLEYYINDFSSTGICYLDLCDRYRIKIGNNSYKCIMFNDEVDITQGLEELIYTDMQEENEQEYKYIGSTDRGITQANIIANKAEATISSFTQQLDATNNRLNAVETKQTATDVTIGVLGTNIDDDGNITAVKVKEGYTFDENGFQIYTDDNSFKTVINETGTYYYDGNEIVGQYTKDGSKQKDLQLFGVYYYGMDDKDDDAMFVAQLYTDENGEECMGHFYNRGDN